MGGEKKPTRARSQIERERNHIQTKQSGGGLSGDDLAQRSQNTYLSVVRDGKCNNKREKKVSRTGNAESGKTETKLCSPSESHGAALRLSALV